MTPALRKHHRAVWYFMTAFLPVLFVAAVLAIPQRAQNPPFRQYQPEQLPKLVRSAGNEALSANYRTDSSGRKQQLEVIILQPITAGAALVYLAEKPAVEVDGSILVGGLSSRGTYRFDLAGTFGEPPSTVYFFDPIKKQLFATLNLH